MGKVKLNANQKGIIRGMFIAGKSAREIGIEIQYSKCAVQRWINRYIESGDMTRQPGSGRPRITSPYADRLILRIAKCNRFMSIDEIKRAAGMGHLSDDTVSRRITESGEFGFYRTVQKNFVSEKNLATRLAFAHRYVNMPLEFWRRVVWTDESPFTLRNNNRRRVIRTKKEKNQPFAMTGTVKHDKRINVWGGFATHGVGNFHWIKGIMDKEVYKQILIHHVRPTLHRLFPAKDFIFQSDNDPKHRSGICEDYVRRTGWEVLQWPSQSPDLNPIENLWAILDLRLRDRKPQSEEQLFLELKKGWEALPSDLLTRLVDSLPRRLQEVIDNKGYPTSY